MTAQFTRLIAVAAPYEPINVDTDQIVPARFLKYPRGDGYGQYLFHDVRRREGGEQDPSFVLNLPNYQPARILVANTNFGCGSSREGAVYALFDAGFRSVIAPSFGDIFFNNCLKNGIVPVRLEGSVCARMRAMLAARAGATITVDLERQVVEGPDGAVHAFSIDAFFRDLLLNGVDEVGLTLSLAGEIEAFERAYAPEAPWIVPPRS